MSMKAISLLLIICLLAGCAHGGFSGGSGKHSGPLWAVWTHSEKKEECIAKTIFWAALASAVVVYIIYKIHKHYKHKKDS